MTKKTIPTECVLFKEWFDNQPFSQRSGIKKLIADKCYISLDTIENWLYGRSGIPKLTQEKINELAGEKVFDLETVKA